MAIQVVVKIPEDQRRQVFQGSEREVEEQLHRHFPRETAGAHGVLECIEAIQGDGIAEVNFEEVKPNLEEHLLPEDYLTADQGECPWLMSRS
jgi:hypothetical protein